MGAGANESGYISLTAGEALAPGQRVKISGGKVVAAGDEACVGTAYTRAYADGDPVTIRDLRDPGTHKMIAGGAIAQFATVSSAAAGRVVTGAAGVEDYGIAMTAASAAGAELEIWPTLR